jgi:hypothetical protein
VINSCATVTANNLDAAGKYVDKHRAKDLPSGFRRTVRQYPATSLIIGTAIGFLAATAFLRRTHSCEHEQQDAATPIAD